MRDEFEINALNLSAKPENLKEEMKKFGDWAAKNPNPCSCCREVTTNWAMLNVPSVLAMLAVGQTPTDNVPAMAIITIFVCEKCEEHKQDVAHTVMNDMARNIVNHAVKRAEMQRYAKSPNAPMPKGVH